MGVSPTGGQIGERESGVEAGPMNTIVCPGSRPVTDVGVNEERVTPRQADRSLSA